MESGENRFLKNIEAHIRRVMASLGNWYLVASADNGLLGERPKSAEAQRALYAVKTRITRDAQRLGRGLTPHDYSEITLSLLANYTDLVIFEVLVGLNDFDEPGLNLPVSHLAILANLSQIDQILLFEQGNLALSETEFEEVWKFRSRRHDLIQRAAEVLARVFISPYKDRSALRNAYRALSPLVNEAVAKILGDRGIFI